LPLIVARYREEFDGTNGLRVASMAEQAEESAHRLAVVLLPESADRDLVPEPLRRDGILASANSRAQRPRRPLPRTDVVPAVS
jgi:dTDP-4-amino-4,6-dideoxygalactose transaminase